MTLKQCSKCGMLKPLDAFYTRENGKPHSQCKACRASAAKAWALANPDKKRASSKRFRETNPDYDRAKNLQSKFGMTLADFDSKLAAQGARCAICRTDTPGGRGAFNVDHDRSCCPGDKSCGACIRGLLCHGCNISLGHFKDSPDALRAAASYLESYAPISVA